MGVVKFYNELWLQTLIEHITSEFDSPSSYSFRVKAVHTDSNTDRSGYIESNVRIDYEYQFSGVGDVFCCL